MSRARARRRPGRGQGRRRARFHLEVDGELFEVRAGRTGADEYIWTSGPNPGYGFGSVTSNREPLSLDDHVRSIRDRLLGVDPETGYLE